MNFLLNFDFSETTFLLAHSVKDKWSCYIEIFATKIDCTEFLLIVIFHSGELDILAEDLKEKLNNDSNTSVSIPKSDNQNDFEGNLSRIRSRLESQLTLMQNTLNRGSLANNFETGQILNSDNFETDPLSENQDLRPRMAPDGGNPSEVKINDKNSSSSDTSIEN